MFNQKARDRINSKKKRKTKRDIRHTLQSPLFIGENDEQRRRKKKKTHTRTLCVVFVSPFVHTFLCGEIVVAVVVQLKTKTIY